MLSFLVVEYIASVCAREQNPPASGADNNRTQEMSTSQMAMRKIYEQKA